ncbi:MAG TPA: YCF48-related protein [Solimonas sp.]|nr:YCF48-related protein [Solimonas sp.]
MSRRLLPAAAALLAAWSVVAGAQEQVPDEAVPPPAPADVAKPALMVTGAAKGRLLDLAQAGSRLVAVGDHGVILTSEDGKAWQQVPSPVSQMLTRLRFLDEKNGWAVGYDATILHTADGGRTWSLQHRDPEARVLFDVLFLDAQNGLAVGGYGSLYRTADGGKTWERQTNPVTEIAQHFNRILALADGTLFVAGERGMLARSKDAGATWELLKSPYSGSYFGALSPDGKRVLAFGMRGNVYLSEDLSACPVQDPASFDSYAIETLSDPAQIAALGWRKLDSPLQESFFGGSVLPDGRVLLVGTNAVAVRSDAGLQTLEIQKLPASETLNDIQPVAQRLLGVGRRGVQDLGALP